MGMRPTLWKPLTYSVFVEVANWTYGFKFSWCFPGDKRSLFLSPAPSYFSLVIFLTVAALMPTASTIRCITYDTCNNGRPFSLFLARNNLAREQTQFSEWMTLSAAWRFGVCSWLLKLTTARNAVWWRSNDDLATVLHSPARVRAYYVTPKWGQGSPNQGGAIVN